MIIEFGMGGVPRMLGARGPRTAACKRGCEGVTAHGRREEPVGPPDNHHRA